MKNDNTNDPVGGIKQHISNIMALATALDDPLERIDMVREVTKLYDHVANQPAPEVLQRIDSLVIDERLRLRKQVAGKDALGKELRKLEVVSQAVAHWWAMDYPEPEEQEQEQEQEQLSLL